MSEQAQLGQAHLHVLSLVALPPLSVSSLKHKEVTDLEGVVPSDRLIMV